MRNNRQASDHQTGMPPVEGPPVQGPPVQGFQVQVPQVSVVMPTYNRANTLQRAIDSVLSQTVRDLELIIVDDASTDQTPELVQQISDPRLRYARHEKNRFAGAARNTGMEMARGEFIAFLDSDDEWMDDKLERQLVVMQGLSEEWGCCYTGATLTDVSTKRSRNYRPTHSGNVLTHFLTNRFIVWTPTFLFRRSCLDTIGLMDESLVRCQDRDFYVRMFERFQAAVISDPLAHVNLDSANRSVVDSRQGRMAFLRKHEERISRLGIFRSRYVHAIQWCLQAEQEFSHGLLAAGCNSLFTSLRFSPLLPPKRYASVALKASRGLYSFCTAQD